MDSTDIIKPLSTVLSSAVNKSQQHRNKFLGPRWVRSKNATSVLCSPSTQVSYVTKTLWPFSVTPKPVIISSDIAPPTLSDEPPSTFDAMSSDVSSTSTLLKRLEVLSSPSRFVVVKMSSKERHKKGGVASIEDEISVIHDEWVFFRS